jgi:hypothetical protein
MAAKMCRSIRGCAFFSAWLWLRTFLLGEIDMNKLLTQIYTNNPRIDTEQEIKIMEQITIEENNLFPSLTDEQREVFLSLINNYRSLATLRDQNGFAHGFNLGDTLFRNEINYNISTSYIEKTFSLYYNSVVNI